MRSKKLLFYLFGILMMCLYAQDAEAMTLRGIGGWGNVKTMVLVETNHWRCYFTRTELDDGNEFKFAEDDASAWYSGTNFSFNLANNSSVSSEEFDGEGTNMVITNYDNYDYYVDLYKTNDNKYNFTIIRADEYLTIKGFNNWNNTVEDNTLLQDFSYNRFTHHWTFYVKKENLGNGEFKLFDTNWASDGNPLNLSSSNTATSTVLGNSSNMTLSVPQTDVNDARYYFDISWGTTGYSVTVNREHREVYIGGSMTSNPSEVACLGGDNYNQTWGQKNNSLKLIEARNGEYYIDFDAVQFNNSNRLTRLGFGKGMDFRFVEVVTTNNDAAADVNISANELELTSSYQPLAGTSTGNDDYMSVTSETNCSKYRIWFKYDNGSRYAKVEKVVPDIYIYGSISDNPSETSGGSWGGGSHPNRKLTAISDGEYKISFDATAFSNSNRKTGIDDPWIGMDFRFREMTQLSGLSEKYHIFPPQEHDALALTSTYSANGYITSSILNANTFMGVAEVDGATYYDIYLKRTESGGSISYQAKVVVTADDQTNVFIGGSMSNDCSNTAVTTTNQTWDQRNNSLKLTYDGTVKAYYIDFSPTEYDNSDRHTLLNDGTAMDFRLLERVTASGSTTSYRCAGSSTAQALSTDPENPTVLSASTSATNNYLYLEKVARATNYRIWFKDDNGTRTAWVEISQPYATLTVTDGSTISGVPTADGYTFTIPQTSNYTPGQPLTFQVEVNDGINSSQYVPTTTIGEKDHAYTYTGLAASDGNITYGVPANAADEIIVTLNTTDNTISLTHENVGHAGTNQQYYVVGSWFDTTFDNVNYNERRFQMKKNSNGTYYFDIPANMNLRCQIISSTGTLYYPANNSDYELHGAWTTASNQTVYSAAKPSTGTWGANWYFHGNKDNITIPEGIAKIVVTKNDVTTTYLDGYFHLTFDPANAKWSVTYSTTRVSYLSAIANDWKVDFLYDESRDHRHFGSAYIDTGGFKILNAWSYHNQDPSLYPNTKLIEKGNNGQNGLLGGANLDLTPMTGTSQNGHIIPMSAKGLYLVEDDPTRGNQVYTGENSWDNLLLFNSKGGTDPNPVFQTISLVGPAFPETMTGTDWDPTKAIDMHYDAEEQCFKANVSTTQAAGQVFRFVADHSIITNWGEESTADADQARVPYNQAGTGHAATADDRNVVKITNDATATNRNGSGNYGDIVFNRPAGNWVIRFYLSTPDTKVTSFYYTISESVEPDVTLSPQSGIYESATLTPTTVESKTHYNMTVNVQVVNATKYKYTIGQDVSLDDTGVEVVDYNSANPFGTFRYNGDAENPKVWFTPHGGTETELASPATLVVNGSQATVYVNVVAADGSGNSNSAERTYVYTFAPSAALEAISSQGGSFINKTTVNIVGGKGTLYYTTGGDAMNETNRKHVPANRQVVVSRPGTMTVTDGYTTETAEFQFTYSTSENYTNFWHNTPGEVVYAGGGKDATSVFIEVEDNMPMRIYAWNYSKDQMLIEQQEKKQTGYSKTAVGFNERDPQVKLTSYYPGTVLDDSRLLTIGGKKFFYLVVPKEKLKYTNEKNEVVYGEMAVILSRSTRASTTLDADYYKTPNTIVDANSTFEYFSSPNTMSGSDVTSYNSYLAMPVNDDLTKIYGDNVVFIEVPSTWTSAYCYAWNSTGNNGWPGVRMSHVKTLEGGNQVFACQLISRLATSDTKLIFTENGQGKGDPKRWENENEEEKMVFSSRGYYTKAGAATSTIETDQDVSQTIENWKKQNYKEMEDYTVFPNGEEYHEMRPDDKTYMLDPTWGGLIPDPTTSTDKETYSIAHWSGFPEIDNTADLGYRKTIAYDVNLTQTVLHLDKTKEYTVQAIVRAEGENGTRVRLTLNGATEAVDEQIGRNASGNVGTDVGGSFVTKTGRVEYLTPKDYDNMNKLTGTGWLKLQAKAKPDPATGNLQITLKGIAAEGKAASYGWFVLSDVVLLEDADRDDGTTYRTTATKINEDVTYATATLDMDTYADYRDWSATKNNAFSFFDRGENLNAVVFANEKTVLCMDGHAHPYNVVKTTSASDEDGVCPVLYLTDMGVYNKSDNQKHVTSSAYTQSSGSAQYKGSGYTFKSVIPFTATNVVYDRSYALTKSTIILPFTLTQAQIQAAYSNNVKVYKFKEYHADSKDVVFSKLGDEEDLVANQPYILFNASGTLDSRSATQAAAKPSTMRIPEVNADDNLYPPTEETSVKGAFTGRFDYARMSTYNAGKTEAYYGYNNNQFLIVNSAGANMKPFRAYFTVPYSGESTLAPALSISFLDEPQVTGITDVEDHSQKDGYIYSVNGMLIRRDSRTDSLPKGIYILNGRKFVVK